MVNENVDPQLLRDVMARHAAAVAVVTTRHEEGLYGLTVSAFCSVSLEPPLVLVCIDRLARSHALIAAAGSYAVSLLGWQQMLLADRFAGRGPLIGPGFEGVPWRTAATGAPILEGALAWVDCRLWATYDGGDHGIFVGQVQAAGLGETGEPLLSLNRRFARVSAGP